MDAEEMVALASEVAELATDLRGNGAGASQLRRVGDLAVRHVAGCSWASITDHRGGIGRSLVASDPVALYLDQLQFEVGEGPGLHCIETGATVSCADVAVEGRWPSFTAQVRGGSPLRSVLSVRLPCRDTAVMNFYADRPDAFDSGAVATASILAAHASSLLVVGDVTERSRNLERAVESKREVGMAMGVLMAHHKVTQEDAFGMLRVASQLLNRKLREVAVEVIETGVLPTMPDRRPQTGPLPSTSWPAPPIAQ